MHDLPAGFRWATDFGYAAVVVDGIGFDPLAHLCGSLAGRGLGRHRDFLDPEAGSRTPFPSPERPAWSLQPVWGLVFPIRHLRLTVFGFQRVFRRPAALTRAARRPGLPPPEAAGVDDFAPGPGPLSDVIRAIYPAFSLQWRAGLLVWAGACPRPKKGPPGGYPWEQKLLYLKCPFFVHMIFGGFSYLARYEKGRLEQIFGVHRIPT